MESENEMMMVVEAPDDKELQIETEKFDSAPFTLEEIDLTSPEIKVDASINDNEDLIENRTHKWEWFHSGNFLLILEYYRMLIAKDEPEQGQDIEKSKKDFWRLRHYGVSADLKSNRCKISYQCSPSFQRHHIGRVYAYSKSMYSKETTKHIGLQNMPRWIRSALAAPFYWDIDVVNAHQSLLLGILESLNVTAAKHLSCLVANRNAILQELGSFSQIKESKGQQALAKQILTLIFYGGSMESVWKLLQSPISNNQDISVFNASFNLRGFAKEQREIMDFLWNSSLVEKKFGYLKQLKDHPRIITIPGISKRRASYLALFLQTEERRLLCQVEKFMVKNNRFMDCYIHDGGLIRKLAISRRQSHLAAMSTQMKNKGSILTSSPVSQMCNFEPQQAFSIEELSDYKWETRFPDILLKGCEEFLRRRSPQYAHIRLVVKSFEENWKENLNISVPTVPPCLRKTYLELKYCYETHYNLFQVQQNGNWMFNGNTYSIDILPTILPEKQFSLDIVTPPQRQNQSRKKQSSPSPIRSPNSVRSNNNSTRSDEPAISVFSETMGNFWAVYSTDSLQRSVEKVLFCWEELKLPQTKKATDTLKSKDIARNYVVLYEDCNSFELMTDVGNIQYLYEAFLEQDEAFLEQDEAYPQETRKSDQMEGDIDVTIPLLLPSQLVEKQFPLLWILSDHHLSRAFHFLNHLYLLCDKRETEFVYFIKYIARIIQRPTVKEEGCGLILYSEKEGVGKSVAASMVLDLLAPFSKETHIANDVFGQFGVMQENCLLLHFEDTDASEMKQFSSHFKNRITAKTLTVERKHENKETKMNLCRYIITTNDISSLPVGEYDRRWAILSCSTLLLGNQSYFRDLDLKWAANDVRRSTFLFMLAINLGNFSCEKDKPITELLKELKTRKISIIKRFMIGVSLWLHEFVKSVRPTKLGSEFCETYERKVYLKEKQKQHDALEKAFWLNSQDLFNFFSSWCLQESFEQKPPYTLQTFSRDVRRSLFELTAQNDSQGKASLPVCVNEWIAEAQNLGMSAIENMIHMDSLKLEPQLKTKNKEMGSKKAKNKSLRSGDRTGTKKLFSQVSKGEEIESRLVFDENSFGKPHSPHDRTNPRIFKVGQDENVEDQIFLEECESRSAEFYFSAKNNHS